MVFIARAGVGLSLCLLWLCWIHLCSTVCGRALFTVACKHYSSQQNKELGWLELFVSLGKRGVKAQLLQISLHKASFVFGREWHAVCWVTFVIWDIPAHLDTFHRLSQELCCKREEREFQRIRWLSDGKHQTEWVVFHKYTTQWGKGSRIFRDGHHSSSMYSNLCGGFIWRLCYRTSSARKQRKHKPFFNQCSISSVIVGTVYWLFKALNITILNPWRCVECEWHFTIFVGGKHRTRLCNFSSSGDSALLCCCPHWLFG